MTCKNANNITIRFPQVGLEIMPYTVDFRIDRTELDYLDAKFSMDVADYIRPYTEDEGGALREPQPAEVVMDGKVSHRMYFRPDYVTYGETDCWIELHDPLKHLQYHVIDEKLERVAATEAYETVFESANSGEILESISFNVPENATSRVEEDTAPQVGMNSAEVLREEGDNGVRAGENASKAYNALASLWQDYDEEADTDHKQTIVDTTYNFNLKNKTALEAIHTLNKRLGLQSWCNASGEMVVGVDFFRADHHVASASDSRVWRYHDAEMTPPGSPIKMAVVNGGMIDAPNNSGEDDHTDRVWEVINRDWEEDLIAQGVAQRPDLIDGKIVSIDEPNLSRDALEARAYQVLANEMTNNNSGSVEINPETSGTGISDWRDVDVGDFIQLIPAEGEDCKDLERTITLISGVRHKVDGGSWKINLQIQKWANPATNTSLRYFSPDSNNYYAAKEDNSVGEEIYGDGDE